MVKRVTVVVLVVILCVALAACGETVYVKSSGGGNYEVSSVRLEDENGGTAAPQGKEYLFVTVKNTDTDMSDMQNTFFGVEKDRVTISNGSVSVPCTSIVYAATDEKTPPDVEATLLFEVPEGFEGEFKLAGDAFSPITLEAKRFFLEPVLKLFKK